MQESTPLPYSKLHITPAYHPFVHILHNSDYDSIHNHASLLLEQEVDVDTISRRLGHADSKITKEIYLHITKKKQEQENSKIKEIQLLAK